MVNLSNNITDLEFNDLLCNCSLFIHNKNECQGAKN